MKEFVISEAKAETAVLVGLIAGQQDEAKTKVIALAGAMIRT